MTHVWRYYAPPSGVIFARTSTMRETGWQSFPTRREAEEAHRKRLLADLRREHQQCLDEMDAAQEKTK